MLYTAQYIIIDMCSALMLNYDDDMERIGAGGKKFFNLLWGLL